MRLSDHIPCGLHFKRFSVQRTEINHYLSLLPGSRDAKKITPEEINEILIHAVPSIWANQSYLQGWYFEGNSDKETCGIFEPIKITEQVY